VVKRRRESRRASAGEGSGIMGLKKDIQIAKYPWVFGDVAIADYSHLRLNSNDSHLRKQWPCHTQKSFSPSFSVCYR
jgi:hypothetical protein